MNECRRCHVKTKNFHVLRLGGACGDNDMRERGIDAKFNIGYNSYALIVCDECRESFMNTLEKWFKEKPRDDGD